MDFETRKRFAEKEGAEVREYYIKEPHYIQQYGDSAPSLILASADAPVRVLLPHGKKIKRKDKNGVETEHDFFKETKHMTLAEPPKPIPAHRPGPAVKEFVKKSHELDLKAKAEPKAEKLDK